MDEVNLYTDGGSRNNPGLAGIAFVIKDLEGVTLKSGGRFVGVKTNNEAEYLALSWGLEEAKKLGVEKVNCLLDSELVVSQLKGIYRIKQAHLAKLVLKIRFLEKQFKEVSFEYIPREKNKEADGLVNEAIDGG